MTYRTIRRRDPRWPTRRGSQLTPGQSRRRTTADPRARDLLRHAHGRAATDRRAHVRAARRRPACRSGLPPANAAVARTSSSESDNAAATAGNPSGMPTRPIARTARRRTPASGSSERATRSGSVAAANVRSDPGAGAATVRGPRAGSRSTRDCSSRSSQPTRLCDQEGATGADAGCPVADGGTEGGASAPDFDRHRERRRRSRRAQLSRTWTRSCAMISRSMMSPAFQAPAGSRFHRWPTGPARSRPGGQPDVAGGVEAHAASYRSRCTGGYRAERRRIAARCLARTGHPILAGTVDFGYLAIEGRSGPGQERHSPSGSARGCSLAAVVLDERDESVPGRLLQRAARAPQHLESSSSSRSTWHRQQLTLQQAISSIKHDDLRLHLFDRDQDLRLSQPRRQRLIFICQLLFDLHLATSVPAIWSSSPRPSRDTARACRRA